MIHCRYMCGRTSVLRSPQEIQAAVGSRCRIVNPPRSNLRRRYNLAPTQAVPIVYCSPASRHPPTTTPRESSNKPISTSTVRNAHPQSISAFTPASEQLHGARDPFVPASAFLSASISTTPSMVDDSHDEDRAAPSTSPYQPLHLHYMAWGYPNTTQPLPTQRPSAPSQKTLARPSPLPEPVAHSRTDIFAQHIRLPYPRLGSEVLAGETGMDTHTPAAKAPQVLHTQHNIRASNTSLLLHPRTRRAVMLVDGFFEWQDPALGGVDPGTAACGELFVQFKRAGGRVTKPVCEDDVVGRMGAGRKRAFFLQAGWDAALEAEYSTVGECVAACVAQGGAKMHCQDTAAGARVIRLAHAQNAEHTRNSDSDVTVPVTTAMSPFLLDEERGGPVEAALQRPLLWVAAAFAEVPAEVGEGGNGGSDRDSGDSATVFAGEGGPAGTTWGVGVVTTDANEQVWWLHHRMPLLLSPSDAIRWLDPSSPPSAVAEILARPVDPCALPLTWRRVGDAVTRNRKRTLSVDEEWFGEEDWLMDEGDWRAKQLHRGIGKFIQGQGSKKQRLDVSQDSCQNTMEIASYLSAETDAAPMAIPTSGKVMAHLNDVVDLLPQPHVSTHSTTASTNSVIQSDNASLVHERVATSVPPTRVPTKRVKIRHRPNRRPHPAFVKIEVQDEQER